MVSIIAHELIETVTDPDGNAWYDDKGYENADKVRAPPLDKTTGAALLSTAVASLDICRGDRTQMSTDSQ
jgi:hypothetical protein